LILPFSWIISAILEGNAGIIVEINQVKNLWVQAYFIINLTEERYGD
jgi:hypothetical protein